MNRQTQLNAREVRYALRYGADALIAAERRGADDFGPIFQWIKDRSGAKHWAVDAAELTVQQIGLRPALSIAFRYHPPHPDDHDQHAPDRRDPVDDPTYRTGSIQGIRDYLAEDDRPARTNN